MTFPVFDPGGPDAARISQLGWVLIVLSAVIYVAVLLATAWALWRRRLPSDDSPRTAARATATVTTASAATALILVLLTFASMYFGRVVAMPSAPDTILIDVIGHQWWWEFQYHDTSPSGLVTTANELHIPVRMPVTLRTQSRDVIHSFWVPQLQGKRDLIPGQVSTITLTADSPGTFAGRCAEFCGAQHARMAFTVVAHRRPDFERWVKAQRQPAREPATADEMRGREVFLQSTCLLCHTVRGTTAGGRVGPDLTHVASRAHIAGGVLPNAPEHLSNWIRDPQAIKPGSRMPPQPVGGEDLRALVIYLRSLQ